MFYSPLRYPGGKGKLTPFIEMLIEVYGHKGGTYIEIQACTRILQSSEPPPFLRKNPQTILVYLGGSVKNITLHIVVKSMNFLSYF